MTYRGGGIVELTTRISHITVLYTFTHAQMSYLCLGHVSNNAIYRHSPLLRDFFHRVTDT